MSSYPTQNPHQNSRRGPWTKAEDDLLLDLVDVQGPLNWVRIAGTIRTRTPKQCRERYHQNLKPTLNHEPITAEEGRQIEDLVRVHGRKWAEIARKLHNRSDNAVKNWWNGSQNRRKRAERRKSERQLSPPPSSDTTFATAASARFYQAYSARSYQPHPPPLQCPLPQYRNYGVDRGLPSPGVSPISDVAPQLVSDRTSHVSSSPTSYSPSNYSPTSYQQRSNTYELPPLKISPDGPRQRQAALPTPIETSLPSLSTMTGNPPPSAYPPPTPVSMSYSHSQVDYYPRMSRLPTAPSSPVGQTDRYREYQPGQYQPEQYQPEQYQPEQYQPGQYQPDQGDDKPAPPRQPDQRENTRRLRVDDMLQ
ncbi:Myb-like DNA-binding protein [Diplogelasinospora grovesii]|uniref:Myb-like DNA-binding protein n=1 Tax=Diplogelasinospora grovesii TaxID=303347 RepID=A0AAN6S1N5_9PEZI|nr:Myb-like DNA-binding protein [Diplogelasinospora grovesii]